MTEYTANSFKTREEAEIFSVARPPSLVYSAPNGDKVFKIKGQETEEYLVYTMKEI